MVTCRLQLYFGAYSAIKRMHGQFSFELDEENREMPKDITHPFTAIIEIVLLSLIEGFITSELTEIPPLDVSSRAPEAMVM
jgi:hypothetical protein